MSKGETKHLVDVTGLSQPGTALVNRVSEAVRGLVAPWQMRRMAKAEADAELTRAEAEVKVRDLKERALARGVAEEVFRQANMESITSLALPKLQSQARPEEMAIDWVANFFEKARIVSDEEMQELWASILAGEANAPGSFSRRTVNLMADLDRPDAEAFLALCRFGVMFEDSFHPVVLDHDADIYKRAGLGFEPLLHLDSLGLIRFDSLAGFVIDELPKFPVISYHGTRLPLELPNESDHKLESGFVLFTQPGKELARVCNPEPVEGFVNHLLGEWDRFVIDKPDTEQVAPPDPSPSARGG